MKRYAGLATIASAVAFSTILIARADEKTGNRLPVIIIKADDMSTAGAKKGEAISRKWQAFLDVLQAKNIRATVGIQGWSLEGDHPAYFNRLKELHKKGPIEFWNHGYFKRATKEQPDEFAGASFEQQKVALEKTQRLAKEKLGIELTAFGPHWSPTDENTEKALEAFPEIKFWFFGPKNPKVSRKFIFKRTVDLEYPTFDPNLEKFRARLGQFEQWGTLEDYIVLQGHPNQWDEKRLGEFVKIVDYLKEKGAVFMTASEYYETRAALKAGRQ